MVIWLDIWRIINNQNNIYMIKRERTRKSKIEQNPYMYYMTNWGFMETEIKEDRPVALKKENDKLEK